MEPLRAAVVIDYQNIHLTGYHRFCAAGSPIHDSLIHPLHFAVQALLARTRTMMSLGKDPGQVQLKLVDTYRGLPSNTEQPEHYSRSLAQQSEWTKDPRVAVTLRPLKYAWDNGQRVGREKGVDVLVALAVVRLVESGQYDLVVLAAHDSDQEPAIEQASQSPSVLSGKVRLETAGWRDRKRLSGGASWHTFMDETAFNNSADRRVY